MGQIIVNYMGVFVIPVIIGASVRLLCRRTAHACFATAGFFILAIAAWAAVGTIPSHGSELYGILALQVTSAAAASLLTGLVLFLRKNTGRAETAEEDGDKSGMMP